MGLLSLQLGQLRLSQFLLGGNFQAFIPSPAAAGTPCHYRELPGKGEGRAKMRERDGGGGGGGIGQGWERRPWVGREGGGCRAAHPTLREEVPKGTRLVRFATVPSRCTWQEKPTFEIGRNAGFQGESVRAARSGNPAPTLKKISKMPIPDLIKEKTTAVPTCKVH